MSHRRAHGRALCKPDRRVHVDRNAVRDGEVHVPAANAAAFGVDVDVCVRLLVRTRMQMLLLEERKQTRKQGAHAVDAAALHRALERNPPVVVARERIRARREENA